MSRVGDESLERIRALVELLDDADRDSMTDPALERFRHQARNVLNSMRLTLYLLRPKTESGRLAVAGLMAVYNDLTKSITSLSHFDPPEIEPNIDKSVCVFRRELDGHCRAVFGSGLTWVAPVPQMADLTQVMAGGIASEIVDYIAWVNGPSFDLRTLEARVEVGSEQVWLKVRAVAEPISAISEPGMTPIVAPSLASTRLARLTTKYGGAIDAIGLDPFRLDLRLPCRRRPDGGQDG